MYFGRMVLTFDRFFSTRFLVITIGVKPARVLVFHRTGKVSNMESGVVSTAQKQEAEEFKDDDLIDRKAWGLE